MTRARPNATAAAPAERPGTPAPPNVHVRAALTWLAIFPLVAVGMTVMAPITVDWHPVLRALVLTLIVVPLAVYLVVPRLFALHRRLRSRR
ncbi:antibiotic biosynthesis monooxygenase (ABM) superfamily enzyme [Conyzicola nivalis]|uniref:Antibiotic biosynthesis monooxygenase (ABM) superfamily enzyme n=1 Tax=Conyzicola nivalis TaxID=1477021 RepID=A0ABV2QK86_9MICO